MRFWLLKQIARCMGLSVQMVGRRHAEMPSVVVFATDEYAAVEALHILHGGIELDELPTTGTLH